jgi:hypothetical protein
MDYNQAEEMDRHRPNNECRPPAYRYEINDLKDSC